MPAAPSPFNEAIFAASTRILTYADIYEADGTTLFAQRPGIVSGQVTVNGASEEERRTLDIVLHNPDGSLDHYPDGLWYDKIIKVFRGVEVDDDTWATQIGEFLVSGIDSQEFPKTVHVTGRDYVKKLTTSKFPTNTAFASGQALQDVIRTIALNGGISKFIMPLTGQTLTRTFLFERQRTRWSAITELAGAFGYEVFFDLNGYLVLREYLDPTTSPLTFTFETGTNSNITEIKKASQDQRIYNHIVVTGGSSDTTDVWAEALNTEASSPTRIAKLGDRVYYFTSAFITTVAQAQDVADKFLRLHALEEFAINLNTLVIPWLEANEIIEFIDPDPAPGDPRRYLLSQFSIPLKLGTMALTGRRVTNVG